MQSELFALNRFLHIDVPVLGAGPHLMNISPMGDQFSDVVPVGMEAQDTLNQSPDALDFDMRTAQHQDGFNFSTQGASTIILDILVDGFRMTGSVYVGAGLQNPASLPFDLTIPLQ